MTHLPISAAEVRRLRAAYPNDADLRVVLAPYGLSVDDSGGIHKAS